MKRIFYFILVFFISSAAVAQEIAPLQFYHSYERLNDKEVLLTIKATLAKGAKLYSLKKGADTTLFSSVDFDSSAIPFLKEKLTEKGNIVSEKDTSVGANVNFVNDSLVWQQKAMVSQDATKSFEGSVTYLVNYKDEFKSGEDKFTITVSPQPVDKVSGPNKEGSLWSFFAGGFLAGLGAFIMPCIYAMVPVTVSFFTKRSTSRKQGIKNALAYSLSIIGVFTLIGFLITVIFGAGALNTLASSSVFNLFVFAMFVIFGISFLGAFEITLPASWSNRVDSKANVGSYSGIFFMALTLVIVSFSCTVPFIGLLTAWTAQGGNIAPLIGFLGFSLALSLPFALFAFFPALLNQMAKSGGWLNTIKVSLGFIELALALKFLSSADLAYHWRILDREVYISLWIVIFGLLGFYLLGKLKFHHDDDLPKNDYGHPYLTVTRLFFAIATLSFTIYLVPGLWGAPLKGISAWLPEMRTQDFNLNKQVYQAPAGGDGKEGAVKPVKYTDILESEIPGVTAFFDYDEAMAAAKKLNKPIMIDFTGHSCANCRKMEQEVLSNEEVMKRLQNDFVVVSLYVDDKSRLPESEWYDDKNGGGKIKTMGAKNLDFEIALTQNPAQPQYVFVDLNGKIIHNADGYNSDIKRFVSILDMVKSKFK